MTEDMNTKDLSNRELLELMRREMSSMNGLLNQMNERLDQMDGRLGSLEAPTNPLPSNYDARFASLELDVKWLKREMKLLRKHEFEREADLVELEERVQLVKERAA